MKCKCPVCGAVNSLDALMANEAASDALLSALAINGELGQQLVRYLGLFRPEKTALTFERVAKLLNGLQPMIVAQQIQRDGQLYPAPLEAWLYGLQSVLAQRHNLRLPLTTHGYLLEIISRWKPANAEQALSVLQSPEVNIQTNKSKTLTAVKGAFEWANNNG